jgi:hypothetical protein
LQRFSCAAISSSAYVVPYSAAVRTYAWVERSERFHAVICWAIDALELRKKLFASSRMYTPFKLLCVKYAGNRNCWQFNAIASMVVKHFGWNLISLTLHNDLNAYSEIAIASTWIEGHKLYFLHISNLRTSHHQLLFLSQLPCEV